MKRTIILAVLALSACVPATNPLETYAPVVDRPSTRYTADLAECRQLAAGAQAEYATKQANEMAANMLAGALIGAVIGSAYGSDYSAYGASYGAASGIANTDTELARGGPMRIVDRCLVGRGHRVLSDIGAG